MEKNFRKELVEAAQGIRPCGLCIDNVQIVNVFTKEILPAKVFIYGDYIAEVDYNNATSAHAKQYFDGENRFLCPGLIDSHVHIESSMLTPKNFAEAVIPHGTTSIITDPHELANVLGVDGVKYAIQASQNLPMNQYILIPSCVPAVENLENSGAKFFAKEIELLLTEERVLGVAEIMDYMGVIKNSPRMVDIIDMGHSKGCFLQGHAPRLKDSELSAYICGGPMSCHETRDGDEALEKIRKGLTIDARESSISKNITAIVEALPDKKNIPINFSICTDDKEADDLIHAGHMNHALKIAVQAGLDPAAAVAAATLHAAIEIGLPDLGAIAPRRFADMVLFEDLSDFKAKAVFFKGKLVAQNGSMITPIAQSSLAIESQNSVFIKDFSVEDLSLKAPNSDVSTVKVNVMSYENPLGRVSFLKEFELPVINGKVNISQHPTLNYVAIVNRHENNDNICLGLIENFHINSGAFAGTVGHDSHNLTIVYTNPEDALAAIHEIKKMKGGIVCIKDKKVRGALPLPIAGLLTPLPLVKAAQEINNLNQILKNEFEMDYFSPIMKISTITLLVSPNIKFSDMGLVDVIEQKFIEIFPK